MSITTAWKLETSHSSFASHRISVLMHSSVLHALEKKTNIPVMYLCILTSLMYILIVCGWVFSFSRLKVTVKLCVSIYIYTLYTHPTASSFYLSGLDDAAQTDTENHSAFLIISTINFFFLLCNEKKTIFHWIPNKYSHVLWTSTRTLCTCLRLAKPNTHFISH